MSDDPTKPPRPVSAPPPSYDDREVLVAIERKPTGEFDLGGLAHALKAAAKSINRRDEADDRKRKYEKLVEAGEAREKKQRELEEQAKELRAERKAQATFYRQIAIGVLGIFGVGAGGIGTFKAHDRVGGAEEMNRAQQHELDRIREQLDAARIDVARCCPWKGGSQ